MAKFKILITTSGIGSRLGELTDYVNKSLVRVGDKPALSLIIENYPKNCEFVITLGHYGKHVKEFLNVTYPEHNFTFVKVDNYEGRGSSLGYSILQAKKYLQCPFIFNACDSLLYDNSIIKEYLNSDVNFCLGGNREDSSQYTTLIIDNNKVKEIKNKGELNFDYAYTGICGIKDYNIFWDTLSDCYKENPNNTALYEGYVINKMLKMQIEFAFFKSEHWLDIGNVGELEKTRKLFSPFAEVLEKKEESIYFFDEHVVKFFSDSQICTNRVQRSKYLAGMIPKIVSHGENFYKYKKVNGNLLAKTITNTKFENLLKWSKNNLWKNKKHEDFSNLCYNFYIDKTINRISKFLNGEKDISRRINGIEIPPVEELFNSIDFNWLCDGVPSGFHGDFILDNILEIDNGFCLLDWRQDFGGNLSTGDIYYDLAKLNHNLLINHEIVNKKLYNHSNENCYIMCNSKLLDCKKILKDFITNNNYDYKKVEVLTSIIWINMAPLHEYPFNEFLFNFGKLNLYRALQND